MFQNPARHRFLLLIFIFFFTASLNAQSNPSPIKTVIIDAGHGLPDGGAESIDGSLKEADITLAIALKLQQKFKDSLPGVKVLMTRTDRYLPGGLTSAPEANRWRAKFANENHGDLYICIHVNDGGTSRHSTITGYHTESYYTGRRGHKVRHERQVPEYETHREPSAAEGVELLIWATRKNDQKTDEIVENFQSSEFGSDQASIDSATRALENDPIARLQADLRMKKYFDRSRLLATDINNQFIQQGRVSRGIYQRPTGVWVLEHTAMPSVLIETGFIGAEGEYLGSEDGQNQCASAILQGVLKYNASLSSQRQGEVQLTNNAQQQN